MADATPDQQVSGDQADGPSGELLPFVFGEHRVRTLPGDPVLFAAVDVCALLGYSGTSDPVRRYVDVEDRTVLRVTSEKRRSDDFRDFQSQRVGRGGLRRITMITESGVWALVYGSPRAEAKAIRRWLTRDVLPSLYRHGMYAAPTAPPPAPAPSPIAGQLDAAQLLALQTAAARVFRDVLATMNRVHHSRQLITGARESEVLGRLGPAERRRERERADRGIDRAYRDLVAAWSELMAAGVPGFTQAELAAIDTPEQLVEATRLAVEAQADLAGLREQDERIAARMGPTQRRRFLDAQQAARIDSARLRGDETTLRLLTGAPVPELDDPAAGDGDER